MILPVGKDAFLGVPANKYGKVRIMQASVIPNLFM